MVAGKDSVRWPTLRENIRRIVPPRGKEQSGELDRSVAEIKDDRHGRIMSSYLSCYEQPRYDRSRRRRRGGYTKGHVERDLVAASIHTLSAQQNKSSHRIRDLKRERDIYIKLSHADVDTAVFSSAYCGL